MDKKMWTPEDKERFREMCLAGTSNKELADEFNVSLFAVHHKRSTWGLTMEKCAAIKAEQKAPTEAHKETIKIDSEVFFAIAHELSENAEAMEKLKADNLELKMQLLNQSQLIAQQQDAIESLQIATEQICDHITDAEDEANNKSDFMARRGLSRLFRRYKPLKRLGTEDPDMKEADNACNN